MCDSPPGVLDSVLQIPMFCRKVILLANVDQLDKRFVFARYRKTNRIPRPVDWKARTGGGVSEAAFVLQLLWLRNHAVVARSRAVAVPASSQRQTRRMEPGSFLSFMGRNEERTSQVRLLAISRPDLQCPAIVLSAGWHRQHGCEPDILLDARQDRRCSNLIRKHRGHRTWIALPC